ncbi:MAG TPA: hypothetical protein PLF13_02370 [candidate division Zixibacteria bacterium]|nr:hypothetical protein [candidate division Zixibacteria bacterium]
MTGRVLKITAIIAAVVLSAAMYAQDAPTPQITAEKAVELAREYVIGADTVAEKALKMGEPKLAPLPRDTNVPLDSLLFPDLLLDRPAWAIDLEGFRPIFWKDRDSERPLPDRGTAYIDAETGRLLKVMLVDAERFEPSVADPPRYLVTLFPELLDVTWSLPEPPVPTLAEVLGRGEIWPPYGALVCCAYSVQAGIEEGVEQLPGRPPLDEPLWFIGIKWRLDVVPPAPGALGPGLRPGWTFFFLKRQKVGWPWACPGFPEENTGQYQSVESSGNCRVSPFSGLRPRSLRNADLRRKNAGSKTDLRYGVLIRCFRPGGAPLFGAFRYIPPVDGRATRFLVGQNPRSAAGGSRSEVLTSNETTGQRHLTAQQHWGRRRRLRPKDEEKIGSCFRRSDV